MALQEQIVSFPIVGGVDEDAHPRLSVRPLVMDNCRQFEAGAIGKRYGTNCVGRFNARFGSPPGTKIGVDPLADRRRFQMTENGVVVIPKGARVD